MADTKTSDESAASALDGTELLRGVQSGNNVKMTLAQVRTLVLASAVTIASLGTGVQTFLGTPTSANLKSAITDETGSGALVFANTPTLVTPVLGVATGTSLALTGGIVTTSNPVFSATQTWNDGSVVFTGLKLNITNTASASGSILQDWQLGGTSYIAIKNVPSSGNYSGNVRLVFPQANVSFGDTSGLGFCLLNAAGTVETGIRLGYLIASGSVTAGGGYVQSVGGGGGGALQDSNWGGTPGVFATSAGILGWTSSSDPTGSPDTFLTRPAAATVKLGAADAASPVAQTLTVQSVVAGTSNTAGTDWTFQGSKGTGTGAGGSIIFKTSPAGSTGTSQNAGAAALTLNAPGSAVVGSAAIATSATDGFLYIPTCAGTPTGTPTTFTGRIAMVYDTTNHQFWFYDSGWKQPKTPAGAATVTWQ